jgi:ABC-2 type transport system permease protein
MARFGTRSVTPVIRAVPILAATHRSLLHISAVALHSLSHFCFAFPGDLAVNSPVQKYRHVIAIGMQNNLTYRVNFLFRTLFGFIPLLAMLSLWRTIYAGNHTSTISTFTHAQMISYYLLVVIVDMLTAVYEDDWQIAADIKDGNISQFLVKPINFLGYRLCLFSAGRLVYTSVALVPVTLFILFQQSHFVFPADTATFGVFLLSLVLTALLQFFMSFAMAMLAFWVTEVSTFIFILYAFEYLASGHLFPLDILPNSIRVVLDCTPFPYQLYFPVSVYLGKVTGAALANGLLAQFCWVVVAWFAARWMWGRGIKKYSAVGG